MTPSALGNKIRRLPARLPLTDEYNLVSEKCGSPGVKHYTQKQHWLGWLAGQNGPGYYGRKTRTNSAEVVYNRIMCPYMLLWLAEATGVPRAKVLGAKRAAKSVGANFASQSAVIRRLVPWEDVAARLSGKAGTRHYATGHT